MRTLIIVLALFVVPALSFSATYYVPDHFSKIQSAIADPGVVNGDVIIVRDGLYHENLDFLGKEIQVKSENGPVAAIIDGGGANPVVRFANSEGPGAVIEGFTLTNGYGEYIPSFPGCGGGVFCKNYSCPLIKDNQIVNNYASWLGGGVGAAGDASGKTSPVIRGNTFSNNRTGNTGGAIGGIYCDLTIQNNIIDTNRAAHGGGIGIQYDSTVLIENCTLFNNTATGGFGGAVNTHSTADSAEIRNSLFYNNYAKAHGGGIYVFTPTVVSNSTFFGNQCSTYGGGIAHGCGANELQVTDSIVWANSGSPGYEQIGWAGGSFTQSVNYCDVQGGYGSGTGNIDQDPLFAAGPDGYFYLGQTAAGQPADSPCLDVGSDTAVNLGMDTLWTRSDGTADSGMVDMGYHYGNFPVSRFLVDKVMLSESTGGAANFRLLAGPTQANKQYLIVASVTGTNYGIPLPGWAVLPLNWDPFTTMVIGLMNTPIFQNFMGQLDANGEAAAKWDTLGPMPSGSAGISMYFAYATEGWNFVSNATKVNIVP